MTHAFALPMSALLALAALAGLGSVHAQGVYRSVGPDGKVTFSDRVPVAQAASALQEPAAASVSANAGLAALPLALRQTSLRFPVTLYTSSNCAPCASARSLLQARGVPFSERTVQTDEDIDALKRLSGSAGLPFATIGSQQLSGFSDVEWKQYLDAAGYPKQSQLPPSYQQPAAAPLTAVQRAQPVQPSSQEKKPATAAGRPGTAPASSGPASPNPAGIRF